MWFNDFVKCWRATRVDLRSLVVNKDLCSNLMLASSDSFPAILNVTGWWQGRKEPSIFSIITVCSHSLLHISCLFKTLHILLYVNIDVILFFFYMIMDINCMSTIFMLFNIEIFPVSHLWNQHLSSSKQAIITCCIQTLRYCNFCF